MAGFVNDCCAILPGLVAAFRSVCRQGAGREVVQSFLNTQDGLPSPNVQVTLEQLKDKGWIELSSALTDKQGRVTALYPEGKKLDHGTYKVTFKTGQWFKEREIKTFFPEIPIIFNVDGALDHYHIPLLLSPYGYSTYRGN